MTIAPITGKGAAGIAGMLNMPAPAAKESEKGGFLQTFQDAKDAQTTQQPVKTEGTGAKGKDSEEDTASTDYPAQKNESNVKSNVKKEDSQAAAAESPAENSTVKTEKTENTAQEPVVSDVKEEELPDESVMEVIASNMQQLLQDILTLLGGIDMEQLSDAFAHLEISGEELFREGSANLLVADIMADGDLTALLTDSELSDVAAKLNELLDGALEEIKELVPEREPLPVLAPVVDELVKLSDGKREYAAAESVEQLNSDAMIPAEEIDPVPVVEKPETGLKQQTKEGTEQKSGTEAGTDRRIRSEHADLREEQPFYTPENLQAEAENVEPELLKPEPELPRYATDPQQILDQVADQIRTQVKDDMSSLEMVLHPASLGNVALNLTSRDGAVTAQFTAQSEAVKEALESQLVVLRQNLEQAGVKVTAVEVTVSSHAFEQNLEQGNDGQSEAEAKEQERLRRATRKIDLGAMGEDGEAEVDEADAVTVEMMQADGNRMDYRA